MKEFQAELTKLINRHSVDVLASTPDYLLSAHLVAYIHTLANHHDSRDLWGRVPEFLVDEVN